MNGVRVLVIDDEAPMRNLIKTFLVQEGYEVLEAADGIDALNQLKNELPDLLIADVMMPYMDGFSFAAEMKKLYEVPLIFLSAKGEEWDKIQGLKLGGDDYIVKPFHPGELLARVESVLRRSGQKNLQGNRVIAGPLVLDLSAYKVLLQNKPMSVTLKEFEILSLMARNKGSVFTREQLLDSIWGPNHAGTGRTVDTHIKTIRLKLKEHANLIQTVWGIGYKFEV
ncbi:response regulator transcription factor [Metabacillus indicus]|uniref:response regulator transcription factor n=1 Tax=Metabacillus indicus TaxID=246786 RepID=UPI003CEB0EC0